MAFVVGGVVDENRDGTEPRAGLGDCFLKRLDVGHVAANKERGLAHPGNFGRKRLAGLGLKVDEGHLRVIQRESANDSRRRCRSRRR